MTLELKKYISSFIDLTESKENFNYEFNTESQIETYKSEFSKFVKLYNCFFFSKSRLLFLLNSYEIVLKQEDVEQLLKLYLYSKKIDNKDYFLISEFIISYHNTIRNIEYRKNVINYKEVNNNYKDALKKYAEIDKPYITFFNNAFEFYNMTIDYCIENKTFVDSEYIERICTNLNSDSSKLNYMVDKFIDNDINLSLVISFDKEIGKHVDEYNNYIKTYIYEKNFYKYPEHIIFGLEKSKLLSEDILNIIINNIINKINELHEKTINKQEHFIQLLSFIDDLNKTINKFLQRIESMNRAQTNKLYECLNNLLTIKRYIVSDDNYINSQLQEFSHEITIPNKKIDEVVKDISDNIVRLYAHSTVNFEYQMKEALKSYSEHALLSIVSVFTIDSSQQMYYKPNEITVNNFFKEYYDEIGEKYTRRSKKLVNRISKDYYEEMLKFLGKTFLMHQNMLYSFLKNHNKFDYIINEFKRIANTIFEDDYITLASNIIYIESMVLDLLVKYNLEVTDDGRTNLYTLALFFKGEKFIVNGLMYINYILYEITGLNIRNKVAHGTLINENTDVELMLSFSAIIFMQHLMQTKGDI